MNTIIAYLETMFGTYPQTPKLFEAKAELRTMMEDAYQGFIAAGMSENEAIGGVISEFGNIDEIAPTLGISAEIQSSAHAMPAPGLHGTADSSGASVASGTPAAFAAPATSPVSPASPAAARVSQSHPAVTLEEAQAYSNARRQVNGRLASAVALFVTSPVIVILLLAWHNASPHAVTTSTALAVGLVAQFVFIAVGVFLMIDVTRTMGPHRRIRELQFTPDQSVTVWVETVAETHERRRVRALQLAVMWLGVCSTPAGAAGAAGAGTLARCLATGRRRDHPGHGSHWHCDARFSVLGSISVADPQRTRPGGGSPREHRAGRRRNHRCHRVLLLAVRCDRIPAVELHRQRVEHLLADLPDCRTSLRRDRCRHRIGVCLSQSTKPLGRAATAVPAPPATTRSRRRSA